MTEARGFFVGEVVRTLDDRYRISIPSELLEPAAAAGDYMLVKERPGCLSLWEAGSWQAQLDAGVELVRRKIDAGRLEGRIEEVQLLGRLLSTRHRRVQLAGRGRLLIPEGFREFLAAEPGGNVTLVGAALCLEIWHPDRWRVYLEERMPEFRQLLDRLSG
ncbi:MAG: cell division protein MraZ [Planctomycetes bacterium RBG_16_64_10]|nr:MAG: cell division protein MraZ [Planctomycetes bacterium RBG_16_64_10]